MKYILIIFCSFFFISYSIAQDLIIIQNRDSINCKVLKIDSFETLVKLKKDNLISVEKIGNNKITLINFNFYKKELNKSENVKFLSHILNINLGLYKNTYFDYKPRNINIARSGLLNSINSEISYVIGMNIWRSNKRGFGVSYDNMTNKYEYVYEHGSDRYTFKEDVKINMISLNHLNRWFIYDNFRNQIIINPSVDFIMYNATTSEIKSLFPILLQNIEYHKKNLGLGFGVTYERNLSKHLNLGFKTQYRFSQMYTVYREENGSSDLKDLKNNDKIILSKFQYGVYLNIF